MWLRNSSMAWNVFISSSLRINPIRQTIKRITIIWKSDARFVPNSEYFGKNKKRCLQAKRSALRSLKSRFCLSKRFLCFEKPWKRFSKPLCYFKRCSKFKYNNLHEKNKNPHNSAIRTANFVWYPFFILQNTEKAASEYFRWRIGSKIPKFQLSKVVTAMNAWRILEVGWGIIFLRFGRCFSNKSSEVRSRRARLHSWTRVRISRKISATNGQFFLRIFLFGELRESCSNRVRVRSAAYPITACTRPGPRPAGLRRCHWLIYKKISDPVPARCWITIKSQKFVQKFWWKFRRHF